MGSYLITYDDWVWHHGQQAWASDLDGYYEGRFVYYDPRAARNRLNKLRKTYPNAAIETRTDYLSRRGLNA
jgi:hypothetical protein